MSRINFRRGSGKKIGCLFFDELYLSLHLKSSLLEPWPRGAWKAMLLRVYVKFQGQRVVEIKLITGVGFIPHFNKNIEPEYSLILVVRDCSSSSLQTWCSCDGHIEQKNKLKIRLYFVLQQFTKCDLTCRTSLSQRSFSSRWDPNPEIAQHLETTRIICVLLTTNLLGVLNRVYESEKAVALFWTHFPSNNCLKVLLI